MCDASPGTAADQEVLITRVVEAPRDQVFRAWTDPDQVAEMVRARAHERAA